MMIRDRKIQSHKTDFQTSLFPEEKEKKIFRFSKNHLSRAGHERNLFSKLNFHTTRFHGENSKTKKAERKTVISYRYCPP